MKPAPFRHCAPTAVDEAVALLARLAPQDGRVLEGLRRALEQAAA